MQKNMYIITNEIQLGSLFLIDESCFNLIIFLIGMGFLTMRIHGRSKSEGFVAEIAFVCIGHARMNIGVFLE